MTIYSGTFPSRCSLLFTTLLFAFTDTMKPLIASNDVTSYMRTKMVEQQLIPRGILDPHVLAALGKVERHRFVPPNQLANAYDDTPLPIGNDQTISQPYIVAYMAEAANIKKTDKVLEVGTGCGYNAAVLSHLGKEVYTIETIKELSEGAKKRLADLGYTNIHCVHSDGSIGYPPEAPYDAIIVTAGAPTVPKSLLKQLALHGRLIIPVHRGMFNEELVKITRSGEGEGDENFDEEFLCDVRFVPLIGKEGWQ